MAVLWRDIDCLQGKEIRGNNAAIMLSTYQASHPVFRSLRT